MQDGGNFLAPEAEAAMLFEGGHVGENYVLVFEEGAAPLDGFNDAGTCFMDEFSDVIEDGLREGLGPGDVNVNTGVEGGGWAHVPLLEDSEILENSVTAFAEFAHVKVELGVACYAYWKLIPRSQATWRASQ